MDISTLNKVIEELNVELNLAQDRYNLHPSNAGIEGQVIGLCAALMRAKKMLQEEIDYRDQSCMNF